MKNGTWRHCQKRLEYHFPNQICPIYCITVRSVLVLVHTARTGTYYTTGHYSTLLCQCLHNAAACHLRIDDHGLHNTSNTLTHLTFANRNSTIQFPAFCRTTYFTWDLGRHCRKRGTCFFGPIRFRTSSDPTLSQKQFEVIANGAKKGGGIRRLIVEIELYESDKYLFL